MVFAKFTFLSEKRQLATACPVIRVISPRLCFFLERPVLRQQTSTEDPHGFTMTEARFKMWRVLFPYDPFLFERLSNETHLLYSKRDLLTHQKLSLSSKHHCSPQEVPQWCLLNLKTNGSQAVFVGLSSWLGSTSRCNSLAAVARDSSPRDQNQPGPTANQADKQTNNKCPNKQQSSGELNFCHFILRIDYWWPWKSMFHFFSAPFRTI